MIIYLCNPPVKVAGISRTQSGIEAEDMIENMIHYLVERDESAPGVLVMRLTGTLDSVTSVSLLDCIETFVGRGVSRVVLNCSELDRANSAGLASLLRASGRLRKRDASLAIAGASGVVAQSLRITKLNRVFNLFPTVNHAIESMSL